MTRNDVKTGVSAAASWAWGTSLILGMQIAQQKGLGAWGIWAAANTLALAFFGLLTRHGLLGRHVFDRPWIKVMALLIQCFCLVIQMNIIFVVLKDMGISETEAYLSAVAVGWVFTLAMYRHGLAASIRTDCWQWAVVMIAVVLIIGMGAAERAPCLAFPPSSRGDLLWAAWSACILLSGPIGDVQHWQRAEAAGGGPAFYWGSVFFGLYMLLVLVMARFSFTRGMHVILLFAVLAVTSSTIDSIAVAMHEIGSRKAGTLLALGLCTFWGVFAQMGVIELWSRAGAYRVAFALLILGLAMAAKRRDGRDVRQKRADRRRSASEHASWRLAG